MSLLEGVKKKFEKMQMKLKEGIYIDIKTEKLRNDVEFVLHNLPKKLIKGVEIIESVFDVEATSRQVIVTSTMNTIEIKRQIGKFVFREKRWEKQEEMTRKLFASEKVELEMFYEIYETKNYLKVFEEVNQDVFAVYYGNDSMTIDEVAIAINSLYIKGLTDKKLSRNQKDKLENFVDQLFAEQVEGKK